MTIPGKLGPALAGAICRHRPVVDLASDRTLQDRRVDEGGAWMGMRRRRAARLVLHEHAAHALARHVRQRLVEDDCHPRLVFRGVLGRDRRCRDGRYQRRREDVPDHVGLLSRSRGARQCSHRSSRIRFTERRCAGSTTGGTSPRSRCARSARRRPERASDRRACSRSRGRPGWRRPGADRRSLPGSARRCR